MLLSEVFLPEFIKCDLEGTNKEEVFEEMVDQFCKASKKNVREDILRALKEREARMSTGVQHGIAIPHSKTTAIDGVYGVLGISKKGVDYDALDGKPVCLILMLLAPPVDAENHLHLLQRMAGLLRCPSFYTDIVSAPDEDAVFEMLKRYEISENFKN
jgi:PTS system fructose-specific IIC component/PTS system nitrogen regulatory IIA component